MATYRRNPAISTTRRVPVAQRMTSAAIRSSAATRNRLSHQEMEQRIRERAYFLFEKRGRVHGFDRVDWLEAEKQIKRELRLS